MAVSEDARFGVRVLVRRFLEELTLLFFNTQSHLSFTRNTNALFFQEAGFRFSLLLLLHLFRKCRLMVDVSEVYLLLFYYSFIYFRFLVFSHH